MAASHRDPFVEEIGDGVTIDSLQPSSFSVEDFAAFLAAGICNLPMQLVALRKKRGCQESLENTEAPQLIVPQKRIGTEHDLGLAGVAQHRGIELRQRVVQSAPDLVRVLQFHALISSAVAVHHYPVHRAFNAQSHILHDKP